MAFIRCLIIASNTWTEKVRMYSVLIFVCFFVCEQNTHFCILVCLDTFQLKLINQSNNAISEALSILAQETKAPSWTTLYCHVAYAIVSQYIQKGDLSAALSTMEKLISPYFPNEIHVLSALLRIQLQIGNVNAAQILLSEIEKTVDTIFAAKGISSFDGFVEAGEDFSEEDVDIIHLVYCDRYLIHRLRSALSSPSLSNFQLNFLLERL